jgi:hypothetical protein
MWIKVQVRAAVMMRTCSACIPTGKVCFREDNRMNHHHRKILHSLFDHPISANIAFKDVEHVLIELGAELDTRSGDRTAVALNGRSAVFHRAHHSMTKDEVVHLRHFLEDCGIDPVQYPM